MVRFTSRIDRKGRVLISADIRKILKLGYGSEIFVETKSASFYSRIDERGRFSFPSKIRKNYSFVEGKIRRCIL